MVSRTVDGHEHEKAWYTLELIVEILQLGLLMGNAVSRASAQNSVSRVERAHLSHRVKKRDSVSIRLEQIETEGLEEYDV